MESYHQSLAEELAYLESTITIISRELTTQAKVLVARKKALIEARKDMWENTVNVSSDFTRLTEVNQYMSDVNQQTIRYESTINHIRKYERSLASPYFGRFDFQEEGVGIQEQIYLGLNSVLNPETYDVLVYDWRSPIASVYYQYELGKASYLAPSGWIAGDVLGKRQYKIQNSQLKHFFDCSIVINDEILQAVLSANASSKMRNIVETIQKEQDCIIRDTEHELILVQGVAGGGKTSIALHRIAFLLYQGVNTALTSNNMLIISPNAIFSKYISSVLPELGEENVQQITFEEIVQQLLVGGFGGETRNMQIEALLATQNSEAGSLRNQSIALKGANCFTEILDRLIWHYQSRVIPFRDVYFAGKIMATRQELKNQVLNDKLGLPLVKRLARIKHKLLESVQPLRKRRLEQIEKIVQGSEGHQFEIKAYSRLLARKQSRLFAEQLEQFAQVEYLQIYQLLFNEAGLFHKLAEGIELPEQIEAIITSTQQKLAAGQVDFEDFAPLLYLKLSLEGNNLFSEIKQVVIDEAQDYYPMHYQVFKLLFKDARLTVLGDIDQTVEKPAELALYDTVAEIFAKPKTLKLSLNKSYRSSLEINNFLQKLMGRESEYVCLERQAGEPRVICQDSIELLDLTIVQDLTNYLAQGYETIAIICKNSQTAAEVYGRLKQQTDLRLVNTAEGEITKGVVVIPAYMAKGLEFDVVLVYDVSKSNYSTDLDQKLLYIACTRALHQLDCYYTGESSPFITLSI